MCPKWLSSQDLIVSASGNNRFLSLRHSVTRHHNIQTDSCTLRVPSLRRIARVLEVAPASSCDSHPLGSYPGWSSDFSRCLRGTCLKAELRPGQSTPGSVGCHSLVELGGRGDSHRGSKHRLSFRCKGERPSGPYSRSGCWPRPLTWAERA